MAILAMANRQGNAGKPTATADRGIVLAGTGKSVLYTAFLNKVI